MVDAEEKPEGLFRHAVEEPVEVAFVDGLSVGAQDGVLVPFAPQKGELGAVGVAQTAADAEGLVLVDEVVRRVLRDPVEQAFEGAQGGTFPRLVGPVEDVHPLMPLGQVEPDVGEGPECAQVELEDLHSSTPPARIRSISTCLTPSAARLTVSGSSRRIASSPLFSSCGSFS